MKNLHKKIGAIALAGLVLAGGIGVSGINVDAAAKGSKVNKLISNPKDIKKYKQNLYGIQLPKSDLFGRHDSIKGLLDNDNDPRVKKLKEEIDDICKHNEGKRIEVVFLSSEVDKPGMNSLKEKKRGVNAFLEGLEKLLGNKFKGDKNFFSSGGQLFFDDVYDFKMYLEMESEKMESGYFRVQIANVEGIFRIESGRAEGGGKGK